MDYIDSMKSIYVVIFNQIFQTIFMDFEDQVDLFKEKLCDGSNQLEIRVLGSNEMWLY